MDSAQTKPDPIEQNGQRQSSLWLWLAGAVLFAASLMISGYQLYSNNHAMQIPYMQWLVDPSLYPNDPFIDTFDSYIGPVWRIVAFTSQLIDLETTLLIFFLITRALVLFAAARLALAIVPGSILAAVGAMAFFALVPAPVIGHGTLVLNYFEHTGLSIAFLLLAAGAFYNKRNYQWSILLAVGFNLNILYGAYACLYFAAVFLILPEYRTTWKDWLIPFGLFLALSLITIIPTAASIPTEPIKNELWLKASQVRHPFHIFPHTWSSLGIMVFLALAIVFTAVMIIFRKELRKLSSFGLVWLGVSIFWLLFALAAAYVFRSPVMLILQSARGTDLWFAFAAAALISTFAYKIELRSKYQRFFVILFFISIFWLNYFYFPRFTIGLWLVISLLVLLKPTHQYLLKKESSTVISIVVILMVLLFGILRVNVRQKGGMVLGMLILPNQEMIAIADWARQNTGKDAVFLIDPNWEEFRALSKRPLFVAWKDGTAIFWDQAFVKEWVARLQALGFDFDKAGLGTTKGSSQLSRLFEKMDDEHVAEIGLNYPLNYWVVAVDKSSSYPEVHRSERFKILEITP